jgi:hypothetical protein
VLSAAQVYLIYWGSSWSPGVSGSPSSDEITSAIQTVVASSYLAGLAQYRNIGPAVIRGSLVVTSSEPPSEFTDDDIAAFLDAQFDAGALPAANDQALYFITIPAGARFAESGRFGAHSYYERAGQPIWYAWTAGALTVNFATLIMTHELVEAITDPDGDAFQGVPGTCSEPGWCEIADICLTDRVLDGVMVNSYWSDVAGDCVIPAPPSVGRRSGLRGASAAQARTTKRSLASAIGFVPATLGSGHQSGTFSEGGCLYPRGDAELAQDIAHVDACGLSADE